MIEVNVSLLYNIAFRFANVVVERLDDSENQSQNNYENHPYFLPKNLKVNPKSTGTTPPPLVDFL